MINDGDVIRDFTLADKSSVPHNVIGAYNQRMFTSMKEVDCSKLVIETESDDTLNKSDSSFPDDVNDCQMNKMNG